MTDYTLSLTLGQSHAGKLNTPDVNGRLYSRVPPARGRSGPVARRAGRTRRVHPEAPVRRAVHRLLKCAQRGD